MSQNQGNTSQDKEKPQEQKDGNKDLREVPKQDDSSSPNKPQENTEQAK